MRPNEKSDALRAARRVIDVGRDDQGDVYRVSAIALADRTECAPTKTTTQTARTVISLSISGHLLSYPVAPAAPVFQVSMPHSSFAVTGSPVRPIKRAVAHDSGHAPIAAPTKPDAADSTTLTRRDATVAVNLSTFEAATDMLSGRRIHFIQCTRQRGGRTHASVGHI